MTIPFLKSKPNVPESSLPNAKSTALLALQASAKWCSIYSSVESNHVHPPQFIESNWSPPLGNSIARGIFFLARNSGGRIIDGICKFILVISALASKAQAIREACFMVQASGWREVSIVSYCKYVIELCSIEKRNQDFGILNMKMRVVYYIDKLGL